jgi:hypothetical protein
VPARKEATFLLDTDTFFKSVGNKLLESGKEFVVVALWIIRPDPRQREYGEQTLFGASFDYRDGHG